MDYSIIITKNVEQHIDNILNYLCSTLDNHQVVRGLLSDFEHVYNNLEKCQNCTRIHFGNVS